MIPAETELLMQAASDTAVLAWAMSRRTRYLAGTGASGALSAAFSPLLALSWAYLAMMRVLIP